MNETPNQQQKEYCQNKNCFSGAPKNPPPQRESVSIELSPEELERRRKMLSQPQKGKCDGTCQHPDQNYRSHSETIHAAPQEQKGEENWVTCQNGKSCCWHSPSHLCHAPLPPQKDGEWEADYRGRFYSMRFDESIDWEKTEDADAHPFVAPSRARQGD